MVILTVRVCAETEGATDLVTVDKDTLEVNVEGITGKRWIQAQNIGVLAKL